jgi:hypothetical protein
MADEAIKMIKILILLTNAPIKTIRKDNFVDYLSSYF